MFVTCDVLLAKKPGTKPQMIPSFKGGFRSGPRGRGAEGPRGRGAEGPRPPFFFEILYYCYRIVRKIQSISTDDKWASVPATPF